jgi:hypothetical protein
MPAVPLAPLDAKCGLGAKEPAHLLRGIGVDLGHATPQRDDDPRSHVRSLAIEKLAQRSILKRSACRNDGYAQSIAGRAWKRYRLGVFVEAVLAIVNQVNEVHVVLPLSLMAGEQRVDRPLPLDVPR